MLTAYAKAKPEEKEEAPMAKGRKFPTTTRTDRFLGMGTSSSISAPPAKVIKSEILKVVLTPYSLGRSNL